MKSRRGISSVVGMVFAIIALSTTLTYITYSMNTLESFNQAIITKSSENLNQLEEEFDIVSTKTTDASKFNVTVQNTGNIPINFTRLWVQNLTHTTDWVNYYDINKVAYPGSSSVFFGENLNLYSASVVLVLTISNSSSN